MENDKIRKLLERRYRNNTPDNQELVENQIAEMGMSMAELYGRLEMKERFVELHRLEGTPRISSASHCHGFSEILFCQNTCGAECVVGRDRYRLQRGDVVLIPPEVNHCLRFPDNSGEGFSGYVIWLSQEYSSNMAEVYPHYQFQGSKSGTMIRTAGTVWEPVGELFRGVSGELELRNPGWESAVGGLMTLLLTQIGRAAYDLGQGPRTVEKPELLDRILLYVEGQLGGKITLEDTANRFWVSQSTITHLFHEKMGISFYKYVTRRRLAEAKNLIREGMPMEKVASRVGFGDYSAFYRAFRQEFGISPRDFRAQSLKKVQ